MQLAVLCESGADAAAVRILVEAILGEKTEPPPNPLQYRGWPNVLNVLPTVIKSLYYRTHVDALVVAADTDDSPIHREDHNLVEGVSLGCRLCQLRKSVKEASASLRPVPERTPLKTAVGVAVPAVEAWYLCGRRSRVGEAAWERERERVMARDAVNELKRGVYDTESPPFVLEKERAMEEAHRLAQDLRQLERLFPMGFGTLAHDVRQWRPDGV